jgi:hypothetical protein
VLVLVLAVRLLVAILFSCELICCGVHHVCLRIPVVTASILLSLINRPASTRREHKAFFGQRIRRSNSRLGDRSGTHQRILLPAVCVCVIVIP